MPTQVGLDLVSLEVNPNWVKSNWVCSDLSQFGVRQCLFAGSKTSLGLAKLSLQGAFRPWNWSNWICRRQFVLRNGQIGFAGGIPTAVLVKFDLHGHFARRGGAKFVCSDQPQTGKRRCNFTEAKKFVGMGCGNLHAPFPIIVG